MPQKKLNRVAASDISDTHQVQRDNMITAKLFYPIFLLLRLSGVFVDQTDRSKFKVVCSYVYCVLVTIVYIADALRVSAIYKSDRFQHLNSAQAISVLVLCMYLWNITTLCIGQLYLMTKHVQNIRKSLHSYEELYSIEMDTNTLKKKRIRLLVSKITNFVCFVLSGFCMFTFLPEASIFMTYLYGFNYSDYSEKLIPICLITMKSFISGLANSSILNLFHEFVTMLLSEYGRITQKVEALIKNDIKADTEDMVEHYRRQHQALTDLLQTANPFIQFYVLVTLAFGVPSTCFLVYVVASGQLMVVDVVVQLYILVASLLGFLYITRMGAQLTSKAHEIRDVLFRFNLSSLSKTTIQQVHIFIAQVNGPPIGIHVYDMFVIDASSINALFGTILTYSVVIFQTSGPIQCICNTTSVNTTS